MTEKYSGVKNGWRMALATVAGALEAAHEGGYEITGDVLVKHLGEAMAMHEALDDYAREQLDRLGIEIRERETA